MLAGMRTDKSAATRERSGSVVRGVVITHGTRAVWPGITKRELARYYDSVGEWLLPHVKNRPLTLVRCPDGTQAECFFQRHLLMGASPGDVRTYHRERGSKAPYIYVDSIEAIVSTVQNGAVELHTSGATIPDIAHPDRFTLDLDPGPDVSWKTLVDAARLVKALLDTLDLKSFIKSTGGNGLHVVVPIQPTLDWATVKEFTHDIAVMLAKARPEIFLATMTKAKRPGKVFVDAMRNAAEIRVAVAAYSVRTHAGATVSTPIAWDELEGTDLRATFTLRTVPRRLAKLGGDPWQDYWTTRQEVTGRMLAALASA